MLKRYFAQSLLNAKAVSPEQVKSLLKMKDRPQAKTEIRAISRRIMTVAQIEAVKREQKPGEDFAAAALAGGYLTQSQLRSLAAMVPGANLDFAQGLLDEHMISYGELAHLLLAYEAKGMLVVTEAVNQLASRQGGFRNMEMEGEMYSEYTDVFMHALACFMDATSVIDLAAYPLADRPRTITVSQRFVGDIALVMGIRAEEPVLLEMARCYSQEDLTEADAAIEYVEEFLNTTNGFYIVNLARRQLTVDIESCRSARDIVPGGSKQLIVRLATGFGSFDLILAADEIIPANNLAGK